MCCFFFLLWIALVVLDCNTCIFDGRFVRLRNTGFVHLGRMLRNCSYLRFCSFFGAFRFLTEGSSAFWVRPASNATILELDLLQKDPPNVWGTRGKNIVGKVTRKIYFSLSSRNYCKSDLLAERFEVGSLVLIAKFQEKFQDPSMNAEDFPSILLRFRVSRWISLSSSSSDGTPSSASGYTRILSVDNDCRREVACTIRYWSWWLVRHAVDMTHLTWLNQW